MFLKRKNIQALHDVKVPKIDEDGNQLNMRQEKLQKLDSDLTDLLFNDKATFTIPKIIEDEDIPVEDKPLWIDPYVDEIIIDDLKGSEYEEKIRKKFLSNNPNLKWCQNEVVAKDIFNTTAKLMDRTDSSIQFVSHGDINVQSRGGPVHSIAFHPTENLVQVCESGCVKLFRMKEDGNLYVDKYKTRHPTYANFISNHDLIVLGKDRMGFQSVDIQNGTVSDHYVFSKDVLPHHFDYNEKTIAFATNQNMIMLSSSKTKMRVGELRMNSPAKRVNFTPDGNELFAITQDQIYIWDVRNGNRPLAIYQDYGSIFTDSIVVGSKYFATGTSSGYVNIYKRGTEKPFKTLSNLVTRVDLLTFNFDESILLFGSSEKENSIRAAHTSTWAVQTPMLKHNAPTCLESSHITNHFSFASERIVKLWQTFSK